LGNVSAAVGHVAHHDLEMATKRALSEMQGGLSGDPDLLIFVTGNYNKGKKPFKKALKALENALGSEIPMLGMSGMGTFTSTDYSLRAAAVMGLRGVEVDPIRIPRIRVRSKQKGQKIVKYFKKRTRPTDHSVSVHFPTGLVFPSVMMAKMSAQKPSKLFAAFNLPTIKWFSGLMRRVGKLSGKMMDLTGLGMPYTGTWNAFIEMHKAGLDFIGSNGGNIFDSSYSYQFYNYRLYAKSMVSFQLRSPDLKFGTGIGSAAKLTKKECKINDYIPGGFITKIDGKWGKDAIFELNNINDPLLYYKHAQELLYFDAAHPFCVVDPNLPEDDVRIYGLGGNPQFRAAMHSMPDQVLERVRKKKIKAVMGYQTGEQLIDFVGEKIEQIKEGRGITEPKFGFIFDCVNCMMSLSHRFKAIPARMREVFGDAPFLGLAAGGEIISSPYPYANMSAVSLVAGS
jgi:hypothetical protein